MSADVELVSVRVGQPVILGERAGKPVLSGFVKRPVEGEHLRLDRLNLEGDRQADRRVHGGPDKAVYAYPAEHLPLWGAELGMDVGPGMFGENLTTAGWLEDAAWIGDIWAWGEARLQVSQPRSPCFKLAMHAGRPDLPKRLTASGRTGWYLRVLEPGRVPVAGPIRVVERHPAGVSVRRAHAATVPDATDAEVEALLGLEPLAAAWKRMLAKRLRGGR